VTGLQGEAVRQKLYEIGLRLQVTGQEYSDSLAAGAIIAQQPPAGEKVKKGRHVLATVSEGQEVAQVPQLDKSNEHMARKALREAGFGDVNVRKVYDEEIEKDQVVGTEPPAGVRTSREVPVLVKISNGPRPTHANVPNVIGEMLSAAKAQIEDSGLVVGTIAYRVSAASRLGSVISQSVSPGTSIPLENPVDLVVAGTK
jgi:eukaryotic-like serine/threonine-protein kinase